MNALQETLNTGRFLSLPEIQSEAATFADAALESQPALVLYIAAQQMEELAGAVKARVRDMAIGEALTESGGATGAVAQYRGVGVSVRNLPAKWDGYSAEVYEMEAKIEAMKKELAAMKKLEQAKGLALKTEAGCTLAITLAK